MNLTEKLALLINKREGLKYGIDLDSYYFAITLSHNVTNNMNYNSITHALREDVVLFVHQDDVTLYDSLLATFAGAFPDAKVKSLN
jgi:hypothetical protein